MRELISDRKTGWLFEPGNPFDLADKAVELLTDDNCRVDMGVAGRSWVRHNRRWDTSVALYEEIYSTLLTRSGES